jgi:hypothetical protein
MKEKITNESDLDEKNESDNDDDDDDEFNDDTDEDDNLVVTHKHKRLDSMRLKKKRNKKHLLSDLIHFDDVDDSVLVAESLVDEFSTKSRAAAKLNEKNTEKRTPHFQEDELTDVDEANNEDNEKNNNESSDDLMQSDESSSPSNNLIDDETRTEAFRHIIAGSCMSIGLKFAGSFNKDAYETLVNLI